MSELKNLYDRYRPCVVQVVVMTKTGDLESGAAFHIGDGWLVTARHVLEGKEVQELIPHHYARQPLALEQVVFPSDPSVDLALMQTNFSLEDYMKKVTIVDGDQPRERDWYVDHLPLGGHLDDWIGDELILSRVLVMGYPRIPLTKERGLVAVAGEVNAVVDRLSGPRHPYFVISSIPRGGFSGGPALSEYGFLLGVVSEAFVIQDQPTESGFTAAITVEPIWDLLVDNEIHPGSNAEFVRELEETERNVAKLLKSYPPEFDPATGGMTTVIPPSSLCSSCDRFRPVEEFRLPDESSSDICAECREGSGSGDREV